MDAELTGGERRPGRLWELAAAVLLAELVLNICCQIDKALEEAITGAALYRIDDRIYMEKFLDMDYPAMDEQHTHDIYSQSTQNRNWWGWGTVSTPRRPAVFYKRRFSGSRRYRPVGDSVYAEGTNREAEWNF